MGTSLDGFWQFLYTNYLCWWKYSYGQSDVAGVIEWNVRKNSSNFKGVCHLFHIPSLYIYAGICFLRVKFNRSMLRLWETTAVSFTINLNPLPYLLTWCTLVKFFNKFTAFSKKSPVYCIILCIFVFVRVYLTLIG